MTEKIHVFYESDDMCNFLNVKSLPKYNNLIKNEFIRLQFKESVNDAIKRLSKFIGRHIKSTNVYHFLSLEHAATKIGAHTSSIESVLNKRDNRHVTHEWQFGRTLDCIAEDFSDYIKKGKPVLCINNGITYNSAKTAAKELGISASLISRVARGERKQTLGYKFKYIR